MREMSSEEMQVVGGGDNPSMGDYGPHYDSASTSACNNPATVSMGGGWAYIVCRLTEKK